MSDSAFQITVDGAKVSARPGETVLQACDKAGVYIPRLCYHPDLPPGGHCRLCTCKINGRHGSACNTAATPGMVVENNTAELNADRRALVELMFIEGNHFCSACEKSGNCELQAMAYRVGMSELRFPMLWEPRKMDASHPEIYLDRNRCILCCRCVRATHTEDHKAVFGLEGRGIEMRIAVDSAAGLGSTDLQATDKAAEVCPVGCIVKKGTAFQVPFGQRPYDQHPIGADIEAVSEAKQGGK